MKSSKKQKKPEEKKTFVSWLLKQRERKDQVGQIAREIAAMLGENSKIETYKLVKLNMHRERASQAAMAAIRMAHVDYQGGEYNPRKNFAGFN